MLMTSRPQTATTTSETPDRITSKSWVGDLLKSGPPQAADPSIFDDADEDDVQQNTNGRGSRVSSQETVSSLPQNQLEEPAKLSSEDSQSSDKLPSQQSNWLQQRLGLPSNLFSQSNNGSKPASSLELLHRVGLLEKTLSTELLQATIGLSSLAHAKPQSRAASPVTNSKVTPNNRPIVEDKDIKDDDVLSGRGGKSNHHPGNKRYRQVVGEMKQKYRGTSAKTDKTALSRAIVDYVNGYGGRFLKKDSKIGKYILMTKDEARRKTSQALRETKELKWTLDGTPPASKS